MYILKRTRPPEYYKRRLINFAISGMFLSATRDYSACHLAVTAISSYRVIITHDAVYEME